MSVARTRQILEQSHARRVALSAIVAILQYRAKHEKLPATLEELQLAPPAPDPFSGKSLRYELIDDGKDFRLYSVGPDCRDDAGRHNERWIPDGDYVFWPPEIPQIK